MKKYKELVETTAKKMLEDFRDASDPFYAKDCALMCCQYIVESYIGSIDKNASMWMDVKRWIEKQPEKEK